MLTRLSSGTGPNTTERGFESDEGFCVLMAE